MSKEAGVWGRLSLGHISWASFPKERTVPAYTLLGVGGCV